MTIPRELSVRSGRLLQTPAKELEKLRDEPMISDGNIHALEQLRGDCLELSIKLDGNASFTVGDTEGWMIRASFEDSTATFELPSGRVVSDTLSEAASEIRIFIDTCSVEIFVNGGEVCFSQRVYPNGEGFRYSATGAVASIDAWVTSMTGREDFHVEALDHNEDADRLADIIDEYLTAVYDEKVQLVGEEVMRTLEAQVMLRIIDTRWMAHLQDMDYLRTGIGLRAYGQRDPLTEYREEAYQAFSSMTSSMYEDYLRTLLRLQVAMQPQVAQPEPEQADPLAGRKVSYSNPEQALEAPSGSAPAPRPQQVGGMPAEAPKPTTKAKTYVKDKDDPYANVGRNDPCPCGSGKKFKKCHGMYQD